MALSKMTFHANTIRVVLCFLHSDCIKVAQHTHTSSFRKYNSYSFIRIYLLDIQRNIFPHMRRVFPETYKHVALYEELSMAKKHIYQYYRVCVCVYFSLENINYISRIIELLSFIWAKRIINFR